MIWGGMHAYNKISNQKSNVLTQICYICINTHEKSVQISCVCKLSDDSMFLVEDI